MVIFFIVWVFQFRVFFKRFVIRKVFCHTFCHEQFCRGDWQSFQPILSRNISDMILTGIFVGIDVAKIQLIGDFHIRFFVLGKISKVFFHRDSIRKSGISVDFIRALHGKNVIDG